MKKIIAFVCILLLMPVITGGCSTKSDYQLYMEAVERTGAVEKGKMSMDMDMRMEFNREGLTEDAEKYLDLFKDISAGIIGQFDKTREESLTDIFIKGGDLGLDAKIYSKGDIAYIITPLIPKILVVKGEELIGLGKGKVNRDHIPKPSKESLEKVEKIWTGLYDRENVAAIEDIVLDTPEGKVKARKFRITLSDEQLKPAIRETMTVFMEDRQLVEGLRDMMKPEAGEFTVDDMLKINQEMLDGATINNFSQVAYIDRDNYVIEERVDIDITFGYSRPGAVTGYSFSMIMRKWDLNREPEIHFPDVTAENSTTLDQLSDKYPDFFEVMKEEKR